MYQKAKKLLDDMILKIRPVTRPTTMAIKAQNTGDLIIVEIGTELGYNALSMFQELSIKKMYLIDPYEDYKMDGKVQKIGDEQLKKAKNVLSEYKDKIVFIRKYSDEAIDDVPNEVDAIYVDGNHDEEHVAMDLENYYKRVKNGGIFGGHDFSANYIGVCKAVIKFAEKKKLELHGDKVDWWVNKK
jgi:predicted O-methyltransferase YrrM